MLKSFIQSIIKYWRAVSFCLPAILLLCACDAEHVKNYYVENMFNDTILLSYKIQEQLTSKQLHPRSSSLIHSDLYYFGTVGVKDDREADEVTLISVEKQNVLKSLDDTFWKYEQLDKYHAKYTLVVDTSIIK